MRRPSKAPRYCQGFTDRHGRPRWYLRRPGHKRIALPGLHWSPQFMAAYESAMEGAVSVGEARTQPGTIDDLVTRYSQTPDFRGLSASTQATYRGIIERFRSEHGTKRVAKLERQHVQKFVGGKVKTPAAANNLLRMVRMLMRHAIDFNIRRDDPTQGIRTIRSRSGGFLTWSEDNIAAFVEHHELGSRAHLALMLLLHTGQRRSDVVRMGWQHVRDGVLRQQKTGETVTIPLHPEVRAALAALTRDRLTFLVTAQGRRFTAPGFTNWFRDIIAKAGRPVGKAKANVDGPAVRGLSPRGQA